MNRRGFALFMGCLISLMMCVQGFRMEQARAATPPSPSWHVSPGQEFVYLFFFTSPNVGSVQSIYIKFRITEINNTAFNAGAETYYRDVVWGHAYQWWPGGGWMDVTSGQPVALVSANHTWQTFCIENYGNYYEVTGYPRGFLQTNTSNIYQPEGIFLPEMPHGGGLYNMSQYNQSFFTSFEAQSPGSFDPQYSSLSDPDNWWRYDHPGSYYESRRWSTNGVMLEWIRKVPGSFERYYYLIDAPGYHRDFWTTPAGLAASNQWGVTRNQRYVWKNNTGGNYIRYTIDGFQNYSIPNLELLFATTGAFDGETNIWTEMPGPIAIGGANLTDRTFSTSWGTQAGQSTHFLGGPSFTAPWPDIYQLVWIIPVPLNFMRLNETFVYVREGNVGTKDNLTVATAMVNGNTLTITNHSVDIASWTYTSSGVLQSFVERNWMDGSVIYNFTLVEDMPTIALKTSSETKISIGGLVPLTITDTNGEGVARVKYAFSSTSTPPATWDQASSLSTPYEVVMPGGDFGVVYLHVYIEDALGMENVCTFTLERLAGSGGGGDPTLYWVIGGAIAALGTVGIGTYIKRRKTRGSMSL